MFFVMGRIGRIIKSVGSGLVDLARTAEETVGDFERVFGKFDGPDKGMASQNEIMQRSSKMGGENGEGSSLQEKVALNGEKGGGGSKGLADPGNIGMSNGGNKKDFNYI